MSPVAQFPSAAMTPRQLHPVLPEPIYFGPAGSLFGMYHAAGRTRPRAGAIVLCLPVGHEYFRVHRAFRNIAVALSRLGFSVLRFDYYGTGDSHDDTSAATLVRWQADVQAAIDELKQRSGAPRVSVIGLRLGATIAWLECLGRRDVDVLVMWEPVLSGATYLDELRALEKAWLTEPARKAPADAERAEGCLLGFPLSPELDRQIRAVDLSAGPLPATAHVVTLRATEETPLEPGWRARVETAYGLKSCAVLPSGADWADPETVHTAVYASAAVQALPPLFDQIIV